MDINEPNLQDLLNNPDGPVGRLMERAGILVEGTAKRLSGMHGAGRVYTTRFWRDNQGRLRIGATRVPHQASAPGEPFASDTGRLRASIGHRLVVDETGLHAEVFMSTSYAKYVEYGTRYMEARPTLRPALNALAGL